MTRKRVTASEKKQRHEWTIRQIDAGMGLRELTALTAETWVVSSRTARDVTAMAHKDWIETSISKTSTNGIYCSNVLGGLSAQRERTKKAATSPVWSVRFS